MKDQEILEKKYRVKMIICHLSCRSSAAGELHAPNNLKFERILNAPKIQPCEAERERKRSRPNWKERYEGIAFVYTKNVDQLVGQGMVKKINKLWTYLKSHQEGCTRNIAV